MAGFKRSRRPLRVDPAMTTSPHASSQTSDETLTAPERNLSKRRLKRATRPRKIFAILSSFLLSVSLIFLILIEIGNTYDKSVLRDTWFLKIDLSHIIPASIPNAVLINSIARTIGLHDFYQVGLWSFCEGYNGQGVTHCSKPELLYWFNPVAILQRELLAGASISLPANINDILDLIRRVSEWMFGMFLTGACLIAIMIFLTPLSVYSRWVALFVGLSTFVAALLVTIASIIATVMFVIFRNVITGVDELNIGASIGTQMFAFMWIASGFAILAWLIQTSLCCCCASRRDVKRGKKKGSEKAYASAASTERAPRRRRFRFARNKEAA